MEYLELKMALAEAISQENWSNCIDFILDIISCREWEEEVQQMWQRKLSTYYLLLARSTYSK